MLASRLMYIRWEEEIGIKTYCIVLNATDDGNEGVAVAHWKPQSRQLPVGTCVNYLENEQSSGKAAVCYLLG